MLHDLVWDITFHIYSDPQSIFEHIMNIFALDTKYVQFIWKKNSTNTFFNWNISENK